MRTHGFTLIEILVAIAIFTVVGILAMTGYNQLMNQSEIADENMQRTRAIQLAVLRIAQDFAQLEPRPIRQPIGSGVLPALNVASDGGQLIQLTRAGWANPAGVGRSTLQRVEYSLDDSKLFRTQHATLDAVLNDALQKVQLLDKVKSFQVQFLDVQQQWSPDWPRPGQTSAARARPLAVQFQLDLEDWGTITRIVEVSNVTVN